MIAVPKFWIVLSDVSEPPPKVRHQTEDSAKKEAARLASNNPGIKFFVLEAVAACVKSDVQWMEAEEMPF